MSRATFESFSSITSPSTSTEAKQFLLNSLLDCFEQTKTFKENNLDNPQSILDVFSGRLEFRKIPQDKYDLKERVRKNESSESKLEDSFTAISDTDTTENCIEEVKFNDQSKKKTLIINQRIRVTNFLSIKYQQQLKEEIQEESKPQKVF